MELNGVQYEGVLIANNGHSGHRTPTQQSAPNTPNKNEGAVASTSNNIEDRTANRVVVASHPLLTHSS